MLVSLIPGDDVIADCVLVRFDNGDGSFVPSTKFGSMLTSAIKFVRYFLMMAAKIELTVNKYWKK